MNNIDLKTILEKHRLWLNNEDGGKMADLRWANLREADLRWANLREANLREADLSEADLSWANLREANLREADLSEADLSGADLRGADLRGADLSEADLRGADLSGADLSEAKCIDSAKNIFYPLSCPEKGEYTGFKKANQKIVEIMIPADAKRSSAAGRKCRASKAVVISITTLDGDPAGNEVCSDYNRDFVYRVGETVEVKNFDENRWNECAPGIHHYITREEAVMH